MCVCMHGWWCWWWSVCVFVCIGEGVEEVEEVGGSSSSRQRVPGWLEEAPFPQQICRLPGCPLTQRHARPRLDSAECCAAAHLPARCQLPAPSSRAAGSFELRKRALHVYAEKQRVPDFRWAGPLHHRLLMPTPLAQYSRPALLSRRCCPCLQAAAHSSYNHSAVVASECDQGPGACRRPSTTGRTAACRLAPCRDVCNSGASVEEKLAKLGKLMDESHASCRWAWRPPRERLWMWTAACQLLGVSPHGLLPLLCWQGGRLRGRAPPAGQPAASSAVALFPAARQGHAYTQTGCSAVCSRTPAGTCMSAAVWSWMRWCRWGPPCSRQQGRLSGWLLPAPRAWRARPWPWPGSLAGGPQAVNAVFAPPAVPHLSPTPLVPLPPSPAAPPVSSCPTGQQGSGRHWLAPHRRRLGGLHRLACAGGRGGGLHRQGGWGGARVLRQRQHKLPA